LDLAYALFMKETESKAESKVPITLTELTRDSDDKHVRSKRLFLLCRCFERLQKADTAAKTFQECAHAVGKDEVKKWPGLGVAVSLTYVATHYRVVGAMRLLAKWYKSGKVNVEADAEAQALWEKRAAAPKDNTLFADDKQ
jgi:hypothetical protein